MEQTWGTTLLNIYYTFFVNAGTDTTSITLVRWLNNYNSYSCLDIANLWSNTWLQLNMESDGTQLTWSIY